jgi:hypothetical protein
LKSYFSGLGVWGLVPLFSVIAFEHSSVIYGDSCYLFKKKNSFNFLPSFYILVMNK